MKNIEPGLGELLRHLTDRVDAGAELAYRDKAPRYRPRYTPIMRALAGGAASISAITTQLAITQGAVSQTVKLMVGDGLVIRRAGEDGRQSIIELTEQGQALLGTLQPHWEHTFQAVRTLEVELGTPLRAVLARTIAALETSGFAERIAASATQGVHPKTGTANMGGARAHFQSGAAAYLRHRPSYPSELVAALAKLCPSRGLALDVGCGTGQLSVLLAEDFERVVGTDVSADQLNHGVSHPRLTYRHETAEALSAADHSADLVVAAQAAHWFDLPRFYEQVRRVAKPGAVVALITYGVPHLECELNAAFQKFYWNDTRPYWAAERCHVETGYAHLPFPFQRLAGPSLNIRREWTLEDFIGYLGTWSAVRRAAAQGRGQLLAPLAEKLGSLWGPAGSTRSVVWPMSTVLGRVEK